MKTKIFIMVALAYTSYSTAQQLYTETFDYALGTLNTDTSGQTPGKGGWYVLRGDLTSPASNVRVENEPNRGRVLSIYTGGAGVTGGFNVFKKDFDVLWDQRDAGKNVLKFEIEMFMPNYPNYPADPGTVGGGVNLTTYSKKNLVYYGWWHSNGWIFSGYSEAKPGTNGGISISLLPTGQLFLTKNQWYHLIIYVDYNTKKVYFELPDLGIVKSVDAFSKMLPPDTIDNYAPSQLRLDMDKKNFAPQAPGSYVKYDNIKLTALQNVPSHLLSTINNEAGKFNLYPNPATNIVTITNNANKQVQQITVYDITGKLISTHTYSSETTLQLNVENLAAGAYTLHLATAEGTVVKKLIKK